jgi:hypothetical protein
MKRNEPCAHMRPDYDRMEEAVYIFRHPVTDEITWPPCRIESELARLGLIQED